MFSQNCQGLGNVQKRRSLFRHLRSKNYNILCLQDAHLESQQESFIRAEWWYNLYMSSFSNNSRGVMILMSIHTVEKVKADQSGNYIILEIDIQGKKDYVS